jgi:hypothetical protein
VCNFFLWHTVCCNLAAHSCCILLVHNLRQMCS